MQYTTTDPKLSGKKKKRNTQPNDFGCTDNWAANLKLRLSWSLYLKLHTLADKENAG